MTMAEFTRRFNDQTARWGFPPVDEDACRDYWSDGWSPEDAAREDVSHADYG